MTEQILAVFDTIAHADAAENALRAAGVAANLIDRYVPEKAPQFWSTTLGAQDHPDIGFYEYQILTGRTIVRVQPVDNIQATEVIRLLESYQPEVIKAQQSTTGTVDALPQTTNTDPVPVRNVIATNVVPGISTGTPAQLGTAEEIVPLAQQQDNIGARIIDQEFNRIRRYVVTKR